MSSIYRKDDFFYTLESKIGMKRMEGIGEMSGFLYPKERCFFCVNCASFFSFDTMHKIDSKKRQKVLTIDKFQYFFLQFWNGKFLYNFIPLLPAKNLYKKKQQQKKTCEIH